MEITPPRALYDTLRAYDGTDAYADVIAPWLDRSARALKQALAPLGVYGAWRREVYVFGDLLELAYALSRVSDVLLLGFQPALPDGVERPWAHEMHLDRPWPQITPDQYLDVFTTLGMTTIDTTAFDPFSHEIAAVDQDEDPAAPIEIIDAVWPGLMLGELLFSRAGVRVRAGTLHAQAGVADLSTLHEVFLRRHRPTYDGSFGWGHNSQWKTDFRRDYWTGTAYHFNVDAETDIDTEPTDQRAPLTLHERRDLLRHRCWVRTPEHHAAHDVWPGQWRLTIACRGGSN